MRYISVCSGIEAATVAWKPLGWRAAAVAEIEPFPCRLLNHRLGASRPLYMPDPGEAETEEERRARAAAIRAISRIPLDGDIPNVGDFTRIRGDEYGSVDALAGGTPCQDFSIAGLRAGMDGKRGQLTIEFARLAHRLATRAGTRWLVWENVPGVLSIDGGGAFAEFLGILAGVAIRVPDGGWGNSGIIPGAAGGFGLAWRVLDAQFAGVPQRRRRVFVIGYFGDWRRAAAVLFERHSLSGHPPPRRETREGTPSGVAIGPSGGEFPDTACTLDTRAKHGAIRNQLGMLVAAFGGNRESGAIDVAPACNTSGGRRLDFGTEALITTSLDASYGRVRGCGNQDANHGYSTLVAAVAPTLNAGGNRTGGDRQPGMSVDTAESLIVFQPIAIQAAALRENPLSGPDGVGVRDDGVGVRDDGVAYTLEARSEVQAVAFRASGQERFTPGPVSPPIAATNGGGAGVPTVAFRTSPNCGAWETGDRTDALTTGTDRCSTVVDGNIGVRRLTPRECERLQGFPDDYTMISPSTPDGPRYKALGNSMAVPVMRWIGERIQIVDKL